MTWTELLNAIKSEGEFDASTDYDTIILDIANEVAKELTKKYNLVEFLISGYTLNLVAATKATPLPSDFLRFSGNRAFFTISGSESPTTLYPVRLRTNRNFSPNTPRFFGISAGNFNVFPWGETSTGDSVQFDYFSKPSLITAGANTVSEPLEVCMKHGCLARLLNIKDSKRAALHLNEFKSAQISLNCNGAIY